MTIQALSVSIFNRWNNASLNTSIATLYPAGGNPSSKNNTTGSPEGTSLPRAEYYSAVGPAESRSRNTRVYQGVTQFSVWGNDFETTNGYVDSIYDAFLNCDEAATSPMTITGGVVLQVEEGGQDCNKVDDEVWRGEITITVRYELRNTVPS